MNGSCRDVERNFSRNALFDDVANVDELDFVFQVKHVIASDAEFLAFLGDIAVSVAGNVAKPDPYSWR